MSRKATTKTFLKTLDNAIEQFEDATGIEPEFLILSPDGMGLFMDALEEKGGRYDLIDQNLKYRHMFISVCTHDNFPLFTLAIKPR
jgi:hypothetical protein